MNSQRPKQKTQMEFIQNILDKILNFGELNNASDNAADKKNLQTLINQAKQLNNEFRGVAIEDLKTHTKIKDSLDALVILTKKKDYFTKQSNERIALINLIMLLQTAIQHSPGIAIQAMLIELKARTVKSQLFHDYLNLINQTFNFHIGYGNVIVAGGSRPRAASTQLISSALAEPLMQQRKSPDLRVIIPKDDSSFARTGVVIYLPGPSPVSRPIVKEPTFLDRHGSKIAGMLFGGFIGLVISLVFPPALPFVTALLIKGASTLATDILGASLIIATSSLAFSAVGAMSDYKKSRDLKKAAAALATAANQELAEPVVSVPAPEPKTASPKSSRSVSPITSSPVSPLERTSLLDRHGKQIGLHFKPKNLSATQPLATSPHSFLRQQKSLGQVDDVKPTLVTRLVH